MLLTVNMGNTRTHAVSYQDGYRSPHFATATTPQVEHYANWLKAISLVAPTRILLASVVPPAASALAAATRELWGLEPEVVKPREDLGVRFTTVDYKQDLGADLFVNAVVSHHDYGGNILNVDLGTASTFCVIKDGLYLGTSIVPGMELSIKAMIQGTALLKDFALQKIDKVIQDNTTACLQSGIYFGYFELVRGMIARIQQEEGPLKVVLTGGIGTFLHDELAPYVDHFRPELTLEGLRLIAQLLPQLE
ncbi:MAG TPA: type III pantothenate kinase [Firmicutes bacterium]|nr:type III pantothenate kinase [Bacillota bacterium]